MAELILVLGSARSGKSSFAQRLAQGLSPSVLFVVTAEAQDVDREDRISCHRDSRPLGGVTLEEPLDVPEALVVLLDCLTMWVNNLLLRPMEEGPVLEAVDALLEWRLRSNTTLIVVSNEVGMGVVPAYTLGRSYRDALGRANQMVAARADRVFFIVAGLPMELKPSTLGMEQAGSYLGAGEAIITLRWRRRSMQRRRKTIISDMPNLDLPLLRLTKVMGTSLIRALGERARTSRSSLKPRASSLGAMCSRISRRKMAKPEVVSLTERPSRAWESRMAERLARCRRGDQPLMEPPST